MTCSAFVLLPGATQTTTFFFSSRRRHTRLQGDWSSDVCSSERMRRHTRLQGDWSSDVCSSDLATMHMPNMSNNSSSAYNGKVVESYLKAIQLIDDRVTPFLGKATTRALVQGDRKSVV